MSVHWALDDLPPPRETRMIVPAAAFTHDEFVRGAMSNDMVHCNSFSAGKEAFNPVEQPFLASAAHPSGCRNEHLRNFEVRKRINLNEIGNGQSNGFAAGFKASTQFHNDRHNALVRGASFSSAFNALNRDVTPPVGLTSPGGTDDYLNFMQMQEMQDQMEEVLPKEIQLLRNQMQLMHHQSQTMRSQMRAVSNSDNCVRAGFRVYHDSHQGSTNEVNGRSSRVSDYLHLLQLDEMSNQVILGEEPFCRMHHRNNPSRFAGSSNVMSFEQTQSGACVSRMSIWP
jgi:hypothetical protein